MSRLTATIRDATLDDLPDIIALDADVMGRGDGLDVGVRRLIDSGRGRARGEMFATLLGDATVRLVVAIDDDGQRVVGLMIVNVDPVSAALELPAVVVHYLVVAEDRRHRGVGRSLLAEAATYADICSAEHVIVGATTTARDVNRYYARLGFAPMMLRRIASVSALRRSLGVALVKDGLGERRADVRRRALSAALPAPLAPLARQRRPAARLRRSG